MMTGTGAPFTVLAGDMSPSKSSAAGALALAAGLALAGAARNMTQVYVAYGLGVGLGIGCSYVPVVGAVQRWFERRRAMASGLAVSGIGVGTLLVPALAAVLIDYWGWRGAYLILAAGVALAGCAAARWSWTARSCRACASRSCT